MPGDAVARKRRPEDEAHRRGKGPCRRRAGEIETRSRRLEMRRKLRVRSDTADLGKQLGREEREAVDVDLVARAGDDVIDLKLLLASVARDPHEESVAVLTRVDDRVA